jgi:hypothetical protein
MRAIPPVAATTPSIYLHYLAERCSMGYAHRRHENRLDQRGAPDLDRLVTIWQGVNIVKWSAPE